MVVTVDFHYLSRYDKRESAFLSVGLYPPNVVLQLLFILTRSIRKRVDDSRFNRSFSLLKGFSYGKDVWIRAR